MKKVFFITSLVSLFSLSVKAQALVAELSVGYGAFSMQSTRNMISRSLREIDLPMKVVEDFPAYYNYGVRFKKKLDSGYYIGASLSSTSTGSRAHYQDYSGEYRLDHLARAVSLNFFVEQQLHEINQFSFSVYAAMGFIRTNYQMKSLLHLYSFKEEDSLALRSTSIALEPGGTLRYNVSKLFSVSLQVGYVFDTQGRLHLPNHRDKYLVDDNNSSIRTNWSGLKSSLSLGVWF